MKHMRPLNTNEHSDLAILTLALDLARMGGNRKDTKQYLRMAMRYLEGNMTGSDGDNMGELAMRASCHGCATNRRRMAQWAKYEDNLRRSPDRYGGPAEARKKIKEARRMFDLHHEALRIARAVETVDYGVNMALWKAEHADPTGHFDRLFNTTDKAGDAYVSLSGVLSVQHNLDASELPALHFGRFLYDGPVAGWLAGQRNAHTLGELGEWFTRERDAMLQLAGRA